ncbi:TolC family protein [Flavobacterium urumqiense]|uniref:Outer membrane protein TolC n=1 Tax=Flavobacterium urumqiense TaxID=935224 RepID=A0A1H6A3S7_9FLAO|nr:TolC family protein [Flavobacterium urumqiense]SEG42725.1 Outer membrane protein TolC [Flavobacterium urumqiense]
MKWKLLLLFFICFKSFSQEKDLNYFIAKAQNNSPLLKDYSNQIKSATLDSLLNRAVYKPQVTGNLNANYAPVISGFGYDTALSNGQSVAGLVGVNQKIIGKKRINSQSDSFQLIKEALVLNQKITLRDLNKTIIAQYILASASSEQIGFNQKIATLLKQETSILKKLTQNAVYKQTDYLIFSATVKQQDLVLLQLKQQYQNDLALLNYLSGETDTTFINLKKPEITLKNSRSSDKIVFLKQFEVDSLKLQNQNKFIDYSYRPSLSLLGDAGYNSSFAYQAYKNFGFSVGLGLSIPIYDGNQRTLQHQKNDAALATNLAYKNNFNKQYQQQLLMLNLKRKQSAAVENQLQLQLLIADALIEANKKLLLTGDAQITEYIIAVGNLIAIKNAISQNNSNKLQIINEINYWSFND